LMIRTPLEWPAYYQGGFLLVSVAVALLLVALLSNPNWILARILSARPVAWVGRLSYSLYLWHLPIFGFVKADRLGLGVRTSEGLRIPLLFFAAIGSYCVVERPILRLKPALRARSAAASRGALSVLPSKPFGGSDP